MAIYLIRHAHAGSRRAWANDDDRRPLSDKGRVQAEHLVKLLGDEPIGRLFSSPAQRCIETVEPLATHVGHHVKVATELAEGADPEHAIAFLLGHAAQHPVLCSHGDLIPKVIRRLTSAGMRTKDANICQKGSTWMLEVVDGRVVRGNYLPPV